MPMERVPYKLYLLHIFPSCMLYPFDGCWDMMQDLLSNSGREALPPDHQVSIASLWSKDHQVSAFSLHPITTDGGVMERAYTDCVMPWQSD